MSAYPPNTRVRVRATGDPYTGEVDTVQRMITDDDGECVYVVRFCEGHAGSACHTAYYRPGELTVGA